MLQIIVTKRRLEFSTSQLWAKIKSSFARISHFHAISDVKSLPDTLRDIAVTLNSHARELDERAPLKHTHSIADIENLVNKLDVLDRTDTVLQNRIEALSQEAQKEVINILTYSDVAPEGSDEEDFYINSAENKLYYFDGSDWAEMTPSDNNIYVAADTMHMYMYAENGFVDVTGQTVDNTIYVNNITTDLAGYTDKGMFSVCLSGREWSTLIVSQSRRTLFGRPPRFIITYGQLLRNENGWQFRYKIDDGEWSEWRIQTYSYEGHTHVLADITDVAVVSDEEASEVIPIESATLQSIARGTYKQADTAMFSGHPDYIPLTAEEVTALVGTAMDAFRTAREIQEENE